MPTGAVPVTEALLPEYTPVMKLWLMRQAGNTGSLADEWGFPSC